MTVILNVVGSARESGKTTLIEAITRRLSRRFSIWTVKHISSSFDTASKDTWRHLHAGAATVIAVTSSEQITIKKGTRALERVLSEIPRSVDLVLVEGFKTSRYPKIITARRLADAGKVLNAVTQVFAIYLVGESRDHTETVAGTPILALNPLILEVERMIFRDHLCKLPDIDCKTCGFPTCETYASAVLKGEATFDQCTLISDEAVNLTVNDKPILLSSFPKEIFRNTVLGLIGSLKGVDVRNVSHVCLEIMS